MGRYVLWATPIGKPAHEECVITSSDDPRDPKFAKARAWALANGFDRPRFADTDGATFADLRILNV
jgi:hypothetical protein